MKRASILVLDSLGLGSSEDSHLYGDEGSDTFGHIIEAVSYTHLTLPTSDLV